MNRKTQITDEDSLQSSTPPAFPAMRTFVVRVFDPKGENGARDVVIDAHLLNLADGALMFSSYTIDACLGAAICKVHHVFSSGSWDTVEEQLAFANANPPSSLLIA